MLNVIALGKYLKYTYFIRTMCFKCYLNPSLVFPLSALNRLILNLCTQHIEVDERGNINIELSFIGELISVPVLIIQPRLI